MARLLRAAQNSLRSSSSPKIITKGFQLPSTKPIFHGRGYAWDMEAISKSPLEANILRILRREIKYQSHYNPPHQHAMKFKSFRVQDRPGGQWITMKGKFGDTEDIKIEVTMFDGYELVPKPGDDSLGENVRLHISVLVDISKGDGLKDLEFICSAWPDCLEVQKVYTIQRDGMLAKPYMGPDFGKLKDDMQKALLEYLEARGINDELSIFLHEYMMNKDRTELIRWLGNAKSFVEKIG